MVAPAIEVAIEVEGLVKRYGDVVAVDGLDLRVERGRTVAVLGPNGAGKSTTVECCEGYRRPDHGTVRVLGLDPVRDHDRLMARIGVMLQEGGLYPVARPDEVMRLYAALFDDPVDPDRLLARVGLSDVRRTRVRDLSGGQRQRLALAVALVGRPEVLFLDEPTAGLDPAARRLTWELVREQQRAGATIVLTTHLLDEAEELADLVVIVDRGRVVARGTPDELTTGEQTDLTFTAPPGLDLTALGSALGATVEERRPGRYRVAHAPTPTLVGDLTAWLAGHDVPLGQLQAGQRSLEDVFLRLTDEPSAAAAAPGRGGGRRGRRGGST